MRAATEAEQSQLRASAGLAVVLALLLVLLILLVAVDVTCYFVKRRGVTAFVCTRACGAGDGGSNEKSMEQGDGYCRTLNFRDQLIFANFANGPNRRK